MPSRCNVAVRVPSSPRGFLQVGSLNFAEVKLVKTMARRSRARLGRVVYIIDEDGHPLIACAVRIDCAATLA